MDEVNDVVDRLENIDAVAAQALVGSAELTAMLANGSASVFHDDAPEDGSYPMVMYTAVSENPIFHADNEIGALQKTIRVVIISDTNSNRDALKKAVMRAMKNAGFLWIQTNTGRENREFLTALDFYYYDNLMEE